jgi:GT2 family glycosyltransferase
MIRASILIVDYGDPKMLKDCLASIKKQTFKDYEVLIRDNRKDNVGFAKANNLLIDKAKGEYIILLNNDTIVHKDWLKEMVKMADDNLHVGMISPEVRMKDSNDIDTLGIRFNFAGLGYDVNKSKDIAKILCPSGVSAFYRKKTLEDTRQGSDYLDPEFFMYCEDTDLGLRIRNNGWGFMHCPKAKVRHINGGSSRNNKTLPIYYVHRNNLWVVIKNYPIWKMVIMSPFILGAQLITIPLYFIRRRPMLILQAKWNTVKGIPKMWKKRTI